MHEPALAAVLLALALAACAPTQPEKDAPTSGADPAEEVWMREARLRLKESQPSEASNPLALDDLLQNPDPAPIVGPEIAFTPNTAAVAWPEPKPGVMSLRYRIRGGWCGVAASMGCHLVALCPVETTQSTKPVAEIHTGRRFEPIRVSPLPTRPEVLSIPSPKCEVRLYAADQHSETVCTARITRLPQAWKADTIVDIGDLVTDEKTCQRDPLAARWLLRGALLWGWNQRAAQQKKP